MDARAQADRPNPKSNPRVTSSAWSNLSGVDEHHEIELAPDVILAIHRISGSRTWQAALFDSGSEESPFLLFTLRSVYEFSAKREAIRRTTTMLSKLLNAALALSKAAA